MICLSHLVIPRLQFTKVVFSLSYIILKLMQLLDFFFLSL